MTLNRRTVLGLIPIAPFAASAEAGKAAMRMAGFAAGPASRNNLNLPFT